MREKISQLRLHVPSLWQRKYTKLLLIAIVAVAIPLTVIVAGQVQDTRQRASELPATPPKPPGGEKAAKFDGATSYIIVHPTISDITSFTMEAWIKPEEIVSGTPTIISTVDDNSSTCNSDFLLYASRVGEGYNLYLVSYLKDSSYVLFQNAKNTGDVTEQNQWTHVAFTYNKGNEVRLFVNGKLKDSKILPGATCYSGNGIMLGSISPPHPASYYKGLLDNVRISHVVRYQSDFIPPTAFPIIDADTISINDFTDSQVQNGQIYGSVQFVDSTILDKPDDPTACDIDRNNSVNNRDLQVIQKCFGRFQEPTSCSDEEKRRADITNDRQVNELDYNLFLRSCSDRAAPRIRLTNPKNDTRIGRGRVLTLTATARDNTAIAEVRFIVDREVICTDTSTPYTCDWRVQGKIGSPHDIRARAFDTTGNATTSEVVDITIR